MNGFIGKSAGTGKRKALGNVEPWQVLTPHTFSTPKYVNKAGTMVDNTGLGLIFFPDIVDQPIAEGFYLGTLADGRIGAVPQGLQVDGGNPFSDYGGIIVLDCGQATDIIFTTCVDGGGI